MDALQEQYDGIPVPCCTWRHSEGAFLLERVNRAARERTGGTIGRAEDVARAHSEQRTVRNEIEHETRRYDVSYVFVAPDRVMVHAEDVTELRESEERLRAVIATVESGLLTVDLLGRITDANPAACRMLGLSRARLLGDPLWWESLQLRYADGAPLEPGAPNTPGTARARRTAKPCATSKVPRHAPRRRHRPRLGQLPAAAPRSARSRGSSSRSSTSPRRGACTSGSSIRRCTTR